MTLALIAAHDPNLVIGAGGGLPWHYPEDLRFFKNATMGKPVIMGRGVFEDLDEKPLPGRRNLVLTKSRNYSDKKIEVCRNLEEALTLLENEEKIFIIGGGNVYRQTIGMADELYITIIHKEYEGDTFFPEYRDEITAKWKEIWREDHSEFSFIRYYKVQ